MKKPTAKPRSKLTEINFKEHKEKYDTFQRDKEKQPLKTKDL